MLNDILKEYPEEIRNAFIAHVIDQETIPNLAACYGINPSTLRKQIKRMKDRIAEKIPEKNMKEFLFMLMQSQMVIVTLIIALSYFHQQ